jgi:hypothetical protein
MNKTIRRLLNGETDNHILPFFWQHGEDETTLRDYMRAIHQANCGAVCIESRPHPDFCGPKWWADMDVILDEARRRGMKVWILDDAHFPTGFANGAVLKAPDELCRQNIFCNTMELPQSAGAHRIDLKENGLLDAPKQKLSPAEAKYYMQRGPARVFEDDRILSISACCEATGEVCDLTARVQDGRLQWEKPSGIWVLRVCVLSRNTGYHRDYINMLDKASCKLLLDAVYEPHWQHYKNDFGTTIAGFFSDEPELGNGFLYAQENLLGTQQDLPWSAEVEEQLPIALGPDWTLKLPLLWQQGGKEETTQVRFTYMDVLTKLVRDDFSYQIGNWCRRHGVQYIGHVIEDNGQHCRTGSSLGHYFRSLEGQDMAGIDDIGGQVMPQGEDGPDLNQYHRPRSGEFYHYGLAKLAQSAAAIEPAKKGRAMCEIFGNYGWAEGVHLEKYLADHFLVRGINYFVPHAFSPKAFPDPDCPPHFYAHGHNPQYRHFGELMKYMNRVATLTSEGRHDVPVAILYHGESEWADSGAMPFEKPLRRLYDAQIDCHVIPGDVFANPEFYHAELGHNLKVNGQKYEVFVVPGSDYLPEYTVRGLAALHDAGMPVLFTEKRPATLPAGLADCPVVSLKQLAGTVRGLGVAAPELSPADDRVRILHIEGESSVYMLVNEADKNYTGLITLPTVGACFAYNAWDNRLECLDAVPCAGGTRLTVVLEPLKSLFVVFGEAEGKLSAPVQECGVEVPVTGWTRTVCEGAEYPHFGELKSVSLPDNLAEEQPEFSGSIRYTAKFSVEGTENLSLVISDAAEGVEVFVNGQSAGLQIAPPYRYDISALARPGENEVAIEVATTLERQCYPMLDALHKMLAPKPSAGSGITGTVKLYQQ